MNTKKYFNCKSNMCICNYSFNKFVVCDLVLRALNIIASELLGNIDLVAHLYVLEMGAVYNAI